MTAGLGTYGIPHHAQCTGTQCNAQRGRLAPREAVYGSQCAHGPEHGDEQREDAFERRKERPVAGTGQHGYCMEDVVEKEELGDVRPVDWPADEGAFGREDGFGR